MRRFLTLLLAMSVAVCSLPLQAWNGAGHRIVAAIAYDRLNPKAKARVNELLRQHPDFKALPSREAFLAAAVWPDNIRGDKRFYDDTVEHPAPPPPLLPGFPDMARHVNWHYVDLPFSPDGTPLEAPKKPNALIELRRILREANLTSYDLPWLIHITGDVHQPLHCTSRFTRALPHGDQGGNLVFVMPGRNLHSLWDGLAGTNQAEENVDRLAKEMAGEFIAARPARLSSDPKRWIDEGFSLAKQDVYTFGPDNGTEAHPIVLPEGYSAHARQIARVQLAKAGLRLADVLNAKLGR